MEEDKICCFFGHRDIEISEELYAKTYAEILKSVDLGCRVFYFGGFGDFDELCYQIVTKIKNEKTHLQIQRVYCVTQERYLRKNSPHFHRENYDKIIYKDNCFTRDYHTKKSQKEKDKYHMISLTCRI